MNPEPSKLFRKSAYMSRWRAGVGQVGAWLSCEDEGGGGGVMAELWRWKQTVTRTLSSSGPFPGPCWRGRSVWSWWAFRPRPSEKPGPDSASPPRTHGTCWTRCVLRTHCLLSVYSVSDRCHIHTDSYTHSPTPTHTHTHTVSWVSTVCLLSVTHTGSYTHTHTLPHPRTHTHTHCLLSVHSVSAGCHTHTSSQVCDISAVPFLRCWVPWTRWGTTWSWSSPAGPPPPALSSTTRRTLSWTVDGAAYARPNSPPSVLSHFIWASETRGRLTAPVCLQLAWYDCRIGMQACTSVNRKFDTFTVLTFLYLFCTLLFLNECLDVQYY